MKNREEIYTLIAEIKEELHAISLIAESIQEIGKRIRGLDIRERRYYLESIALELHTFYTMSERIFEKISVEINGGIPSTHDWHKRILRNMAEEYGYRYTRNKTPCN